MSTENQLPRISGSPSQIYLVYGEIEHDDTHANCEREGVVTWCERKQFTSDVRYVRADLVAQPASGTGTVIQCPMCADFDPDATCPMCSVITSAVRHDWEMSVAAAKPTPNTGVVPVKASTILAINNVLINAIAAQSSTHCSRKADMTAETQLLRTRVQDLLHLLSFAKIETPTPGDLLESQKAMADIRRMLSAPVKPASQAQALKHAAKVCADMAAPDMAAALRGGD